MNWKQQWIDVVLAKIPAGGYRKRMQAELCDHLETQCCDLMESGRTESEAQVEMLGTMGEPETLQREYEAAWKRTPESKVRAVLGYLGLVMLGGIVLYVMYVLMTGLLTIPASLDKGAQNKLLRDGVFQFLAGNLFFWIPFAAEAAFLRLCLQNYRRRGLLIGLALLMAWTLGTLVFVILCLEIGEYSQYGLLPPAWPDRLALFYDDMQHRSLAPWITPGYHLMNIAGCVFLGLVFGRMPIREKKPSAA